MDFNKLKQRVEVLWQEVQRIEAEGGGGSSDAYTKAQTDILLAEKADKSTTYTKTEVDTALSGKQATLVVGTNLDNTPTDSSTNPITSGGVYIVVGNINSVLEEVL